MHHGEGRRRRGIEFSIPLHRLQLILIIINRQSMLEHLFSAPQQNHSALRSFTFDIETYQVEPKKFTNGSVALCCLCVDVDRSVCCLHCRPTALSHLNCLARTAVTNKSINSVRLHNENSTNSHARTNPFKWQRVLNS